MKKPKYTDIHVYNIIKELAPKAEVEMLRYFKGMRTSEKAATLNINGNHCWTQLRELEEVYNRWGHPGVVEKIAKWIEPAVGQNISMPGVYDKEYLSEKQKRDIGFRADALEFAMKSAGSSDREIYEALKNA